MNKAILIRTSIWTLIGFVIGIAFAILSQDGRFISWKIFVSQVSFDQIDNYYKNPNLYHEVTIAKKGTCQITGIDYPKNPKGNVVECLRTEAHTDDGISVITYYALLSDGSIWSWEYDNLHITVFAFVLPFIFAFIGLLTGLLTSLALYSRTKKKKVKIR